MPGPNLKSGKQQAAGHFDNFPNWLGGLNESTCAAVVVLVKIDQ